MIYFRYKSYDKEYIMHLSIHGDCFSVNHMQTVNSNENNCGKVIQAACDMPFVNKLNNLS